ncbi:hypothetical protein OIU83_20095 [Flavobacterium sp. LS1R49]|uniref:Uncharacterized protein n=1 Tax=Flavobacterium shii TaxID=2987687 RepID=A0A9X2YWU1_9FLAO|nr:hypothetical protein [Flavobacterium shii]MCV9929973.1 hypothetical protein [Flavobacterium shii]
MKKFDLETLKKLRKGNDTYCRYITIDNNNDTIEVYLKENRDSYQETIIYLNTPIKKRLMYDKQTLNVVKEIESFYDCIIGFRREYDKKGKLLEEIDTDEPYKFSWKDLVEKMKMEYNIDLMDFKDQIKKSNLVSSLSRNAQAMKYCITLPCEFTPHGAREQRFEIDATTGKTISHIGNSGKINF